MNTADGFANNMKHAPLLFHINVPPFNRSAHNVYFVHQMSKIKCIHKEPASPEMCMQKYKAKETHAARAQANAASISETKKRHCK